MSAGLDRLPFWQVKTAVEACLAGVFAGARVECPVAELNSRLSNWSARELDRGLGELARDGAVVVEGGVVRLCL